MRYLLTTMLLLGTSDFLTAEEYFKTEAAQAAAKAYQDDLKAARAKYLLALDDAAKQAAQAGNVDEVVRITNVKERIAKISSGALQRTLWIKDSDAGFFERLNTERHWIERVNTGRALLYNETARTDKYVEISLTGSERVIRIYNDHFTMKQKRTDPFTRIRGGHWKR